MARAPVTRAALGGDRPDAYHQQPKDGQQDDQLLLYWRFLLRESVYCEG